MIAEFQYHLNTVDNGVLSTVIMENETCFSDPHLSYILRI